MKKEDRREFLKKAGKVAVTAPAIAVLVSASAKKSTARIVSGAYIVRQDDVP